MFAANRIKKKHIFVSLVLGIFVIIVLLLFEANCELQKACD